MLDKVRVKSLLAELKAQMTTNIEAAIVEEFTAKLEVEAEIEGEEWRDIALPKGEGYKVSNFGRVLSYKSGAPKLLNPVLKSKGYMSVVLYNDGSSRIYLVHVLVASAFIPNPKNKPFVNHKNGVKTDNRLENLEWVTCRENLWHAHRMGLYKSLVGTKNRNSQLTADEVRYIRANYKKGDKEFGLEALAKKFRVSESTIRRVIRKEGYTDVE